MRPRHERTGTMSEPERWVAVLHGYDWIVETEGKEDDENFVADCGSGDEAKAHAKRIVADHNGCLGIKDSETTVPELVDVCSKLIVTLNERARYQEDDELVAEARAILGKTGL